MSERYYTAQEARELLGMTHSALLNQVSAGNLQRIIPPGKRQGVYFREEVDRLRREMDAWFISRNVSTGGPAKFIKATPEIMGEGVALAGAVFGGVNTIPVEKRVAWLEKNPDIDYFVENDGQLMGYLSFVPLQQETIEDLLTLRRYAKELNPDDILTYEVNTPIDIYAMAIGVRPGISLAQKRDIGAALIKGGMDVIVSLGKRGIIVRSIQAHSNTPDGIRLMRHIGFTEVPAKVPGLRDFSIDVPNSGIPYIVDYKNAYLNWELEHNQKKVKVKEKV